MGATSIAEREGLLPLVNRVLPDSKWLSWGENTRLEVFNLRHKLTYWRVAHSFVAPGLAKASLKPISTTDLSANVSLNSELG